MVSSAGVLSGHVSSRRRRCRFNGAVDGVVRLGGEGGGCSMKDVMPHPKYFADLQKTFYQFIGLCVF